MFYQGKICLIREIKSEPRLAEEVSERNIIKKKIMGY